MSRKRSEEKWSSGLFNCFADFDVCVTGLCVPYYLYGKTQLKMLEDQESETQVVIPPGPFSWRSLDALVVPTLGGAFIYWLGLKNWCCGATMAMLTCSQRRKIMEKYGIKDEYSFHPFLVHCYCLPCALCQEAREVEERRRRRQRGDNGDNRRQPGATNPPHIQAMKKNG